MSTKQMGRHHRGSVMVCAMGLDTPVVVSAFFFCSAAVTVAGLLAFAAVSLAEHERRAALVALAAAGAAGALLTACGFAPPGVREALLFTFFIAAAAALVLWFLPVGRRLVPGGKSRNRVDEREIMFARGRLVPGSPEYDAYYRMHPGHKVGDDRTRDLPGLLSAHAEMADPVSFASAKGSFVVTEALRQISDGEVAEGIVERSETRWTRVIKELALYHGALTVGVAPLRAEHVYTHIGRGVGRWGSEVELDHRWAIAFSLEMDHSAVARAPGATIVMESAQRYVEASTIAGQLAAAIRSWGYPARAHTDGNYRVIAPLVARDAGLGDIGRMGLIMTPRLGPRVRLGVVTTDLPLLPDRPSDDLSMLDFCTICKKCADNCPVAAIPDGDREDDERGLRWALNSEACFRYWAVVGTDCGVCMRVCPYSHPDNPAHSLVRWAIKRSGVARRALLRMDDVFYGRRPKPRPAPTTGVP